MRLTFTECTGFNVFDKTNKKARPIIMNFARYNVRGRVFYEKWKQEGSGKSITQNLTTKWNV